MSKIYTVVGLLMLSSSAFATQQTHVITLQLVESMLWHEGVAPQKIEQTEGLKEELAVALDKLEER